MSAKKHKIPKLTEQQYNAYIAALRDDAAFYNADGSVTVPLDVVERDETKG